MAWRRRAGAIREGRPRQDAEHYNYFRDYDASIGRYLESDPIGLRAGPDTYGYAFQNPPASRDPLGLSGLGTAFGIVGAWGGRAAGAAAGEAIFPAGGGVPGAILGGKLGQAGGTALGDWASSLIFSEDNASSDSPAKRDERAAYHRRCDEKEPPGLSGFDLLRWKIRKTQDCIQMRKDYVTKWNDTYPGHADQIAQRERELASLQRQLACCGE